MFCMKCGAQLPENAAFCTACGAAVAGEQTQQTAPTEPVDNAYAQSVGTAERDKTVRSMLIWGG